LSGDLSAGTGRVKNKYYSSRLSEEALPGVMEIQTLPGEPIKSLSVLGAEGLS
jgi:hypothetical protein